MIVAGRAEMYLKAGKLNEALTDYNQAIKLVPEALYYEGRSKVYRKLGKKDLADKDLAAEKIQK